MTHFDPVFPAVGITGLIAAAAADATGLADPWWVAAVVVPLAGFAGWLVRWILQRQDSRESTLLAQQNAREAREDKRAEHVELQTKAIELCVTELREMRNGQHRIEHDLTTLPERLAAVIRGHGEQHP